MIDILSAATDSPGSEPVAGPGTLNRHTDAIGVPPGTPARHDAELIVSELSANAILHTASGGVGSFHLALAVSPRVVALSVTDGGGTGTAPKVEQPSEDSVHGCGLGMVSVIAHRVVIHGSHSGYTVTAEFFTDVQPGGHPC